MTDAAGVYWTTGAGVRGRTLSTGLEKAVLEGRAGCDAVLALDNNAVVVACASGGRTDVVRAPK